MSQPSTIFWYEGAEIAHLSESPLGTVDNMLDHAEYMRELVGADHIGLGPDFTWGRSSGPILWMRAPVDL